MADLELSVASLMLDVQNPRHRPVRGQDDVVQVMLARSPGKLLTLAQHIAAHGLNPIDRLLIMKQGRSYVVLEGNRRVAALKVIRNPDLCKNQRLRAAFSKLSDSPKLPKTVRCTTVEDRDEAREWLALRHGGEREGAGIVRWGTASRVRNSASSGLQERTALATLDWLDAKSLAGGHAALAELVEQVSEEKFTTFGRLTGMPEFRQYCGYDLVDDEVEPTDDEAQLVARLSAVLESLAAGLSVSELKYKGQRLRFVETLRASIPGADVAPDDKSDDTDDVPDDDDDAADNGGEDTSSAGSGSSDGSDGGSPNPRPRPPRLFRDLNLKHCSKRARDVLAEVTRIDLAKFPNSSAALIRMVIELVISEAFTSCGWTLPAKQELRKLIEEALKHLDPSGKDRAWKDIRNQVSNPNSLIGTATLNAFLHNPNFHPTATEMRDISDKYVPLLAALNECIGKDTKA